MNKLLPYETIVKAHEGDPDAIDTILSHYAGFVRHRTLSRKRIPPSHYGFQIIRA